ncbi:MAG: chloride channel protein [Bacteroidota bacterium]|jgi:CIC family chloride channel protein
MSIGHDIHQRLKTVVLGIQERISPRQFLLVAAVIVGISAGISSVLLKVLVHFFRQFLSSGFLPQGVLFSVSPLIGIGLCLIFTFFLMREPIQKGISNILFAIARKNSNLPSSGMYSHLVSSALTVGFGGSAGLEAPIVNTGAAIGSVFGKTYKLSYKERTLLLACGVSAGIAGTFNTPIAGVIFSFEVLLAETSVSAFIPLLIAAATGAICSNFLMEEEILFSFKLREPFSYLHVPFYALLGIFCGLVSVYFTKTFLRVDKFFENNLRSRISRWLIGSAFLGLAIWFFPPLFGEGYESVKSLSEFRIEKLYGYSPMQNMKAPWMLLLFFLAIILLKPIATACTISSGGNGGNFAPSLFSGAFTGSFLAVLLQWLFNINLPVANFALAGMAGVLCGVFWAPLTAIFLIAEITGGYELMIPLMLVSAMSFQVTRYFVPMSIDKSKLAEQNHFIATSSDAYILSSINLTKLVDTHYTCLTPSHKLRDVVNLIKESPRSIIPVTDNKNYFKGFITTESVSSMIFKSELYNHVSVAELYTKSPVVSKLDENAASLLAKMDLHGMFKIPVVSIDNQFIGFIKKTDLLEKYREQLLDKKIET